MEIRWPLSKNILNKLSRKKYRKEYGLYQIEGVTTVRDAINADASILGLIYDSRLIEKDRNLLVLAEEKNIPVLEYSFADISKMSDLVTPPPLIAVVDKGIKKEPQIPLEDQLVLALDGVADPGNLGTLIRSAVFLGVKEIWLGKGCVELHNPKVLRSAMTAHFGVRICEDLDLAEICQRAKAKGTAILIASMTGIEDHYPELSEDKKGVLVLGNEPRGISDVLAELADYELTISQKGPVESLNVAIAGTLMMDRLLNRNL